MALLKKKSKMKLLAFGGNELSLKIVQTEFKHVLVSNHLSCDNHFLDEQFILDDILN